MHKNYPTTDHRWPINSDTEFPLQLHKEDNGNLFFPTIMLQHQSRGKSSRQALEAQLPALTEKTRENQRQHTFRTGSNSSNSSLLVLSE